MVEKDDKEGTAASDRFTWQPGDIEFEDEEEGAVESKSETTHDDMRSRIERLKE